MGRGKRRGKQEGNRKAKIRKEENGEKEIHETEGDTRQWIQ